MRLTRPHRPSHATVIAYLALFIALGGTAGALAGKNRVDSRDIKPKAVHVSDLANHAVSGPKLRNGAVSGAKVLDQSLGEVDLGEGSVGTGELKSDSVNPDKLDLFRSAESTGSIPITGGGSQPLGPTIKLDFTPGGLVVLFGRADIGTSNNNTNCRLEATFGNTTVYLLEADADSGNPPLPFASNLVPYFVSGASPTGTVTVTLSGSLNGVTTNTCTYVNPALRGFVVG